MIYLKLQN